MVRSVRKPKLRVRRQRLNKEPHTGREEAKRRDGKAMAMAMARHSPSEAKSKSSSSSSARRRSGFFHALQRWPTPRGKILGRPALAGPPPHPSDPASAGPSRLRVTVVRELCCCAATRVKRGSKSLSAGMGGWVGWVGRWVGGTLAGLHCTRERARGRASLLLLGW